MEAFEAELLERAKQNPIVFIAPGHDINHPGAIGTSVEHIYVTAFTHRMALIALFEGLPFFYLDGEPVSFSASGEHGFLAAITHKRNMAKHVAQSGRETFLFEFHLNADAVPNKPGKASGSMIIYREPDNEPIARKFAHHYTEYGRAIGAPMVAVKPCEVVHRGNLALLKPVHPRLHQFIVELGFVDNPDEMAWLWANLKQMAMMVVYSIAKTVGYPVDDDIMRLDEIEQKIMRSILNT